MAQDLFRGGISSAGSVLFSDPSGPHYSVTRLSTGVYEVILDQMRPPGEVWAHVAAQREAGDATDISSGAPEYMTHTDGMGTQRCGVICRFYERNTTNARDCRFGLVVQAPV